MFLPGLNKLPTGEVCDVFGNVRSNGDQPLKMGRLLYQEYHDLLDGRPILRHNEQWTKPKTDLLREQHRWMFKKQYCPKELRLYREVDGQQVNRYGKGVVLDTGFIRPLSIPTEDDRLIEEEPMDRVEQETEMLSMEIDRAQLLSGQEFKNRQLMQFFQHLPDELVGEATRKLERDTSFLREVLYDPEGMAVELVEELHGVDSEASSAHIRDEAPSDSDHFDYTSGYDTEGEDWSDMEERLAEQDAQVPQKRCRFVEDEALEDPEEVEDA